MDPTDLRSSLRSRASKSGSDLSDGQDEAAKENTHPGGQVKYGLFMQGVRLVLLVFWWTLCTLTIHATQFLGAPLYLINRDYYYAWMALTKQQYGIFVTTLTAWFSPTPVWVSGDKSVGGQLKLSSNGALVTQFPERMILIANHQLYTDWLYLWWIAYTSRLHGHIFIMLKESLKYVPVIGPGMMFFSFIFMSRKWAKDQERMHYRLQKLASRHKGPMSGTQDLDPMWLLMFPEGTNVSANTRKSSSKWAEKLGVQDMRWQVMPRSTGLRFILSELKGTVDWVYDCTMAYEGIPRGGYGQDYFGLRSTYIQGRPPKSVNMYWRRFPISSIPADDTKAFDDWMLQRWREKDDLLEHFAQHGRFPPSDADPNSALAPAQATVMPKRESGYLVTEVKLAHWIEVGQIFVTVATSALVINVGMKLWNFVSSGSF